MSNPFPIRPTETLPMFVARCACNTGVALPSFLRHMQARFDRTGELAASIAALSKFTRCDPELLASRAMITSYKSRTTINGQLVFIRDVARDAARYCPVCLQADLKTYVGKPWSRPWCRPSWQHTMLANCVEHRTPLVALSGQKASRGCFDWSGIIKKHWNAVSAVGGQLDVVEVTPFEQYFSGRLDGVPVESNDLLDSLPFETAMSLCSVIGAMLENDDSFSPRYNSSGRRVELAVIGHDAIANGYRSLTKVLEIVDKRTWEAGWSGGLKNVYPHLYDFLRARTRYGSEDGVMNLRAFVRDHAMTAFPLGPTDGFLSSGGTRILHSVRTATVEYRLHAKTVRKVLGANGLLPENADTLTDNEILINADAVSRVMAAWNETMSAVDVRKRLRISPDVIAQFVEANLLEQTDADPRHRLRSGFTTASVEGLMERITEKATADPSAPGMTRLVDIRLMNFVEITKLILAGEIDVAVQRVGEPDFRHILVNHNAIKNEVFPGEPAGTVPMFRVTDVLKVTVKAVRQLASLGEIATVSAIGPRGAHVDFYVLASVQKFAENYVSRRTLARYRGRKALDEYLAGVVPAFSFRDGVRLYRRIDLPKR
ncbi:TniQ family protein [Rhizobium sp. GCM10022189]|uniref:TniQ family protein n=1 Tax=Rhizobium sp. GCM10022189 TaxID=3252654 RepID=UPI003612F306